MSSSDDNSFPAAEANDPLSVRLTCSISGFDQVLCGGLLARRCYLVKGPPGTGKTVFAAQFCCDQALRGQRSSFVTLLSESHATLLSNLRLFSFFDEQIVGDRLHIVSGYEPLCNEGLAGLTALLRDTLRKRRPAVLVIDSISSILEEAGSPQEAKAFFRELTTVSEVVGCTLVYLSLAVSNPKYVLVETVVDGILELCKQSADLRTFRTLEVSKFRGSGHLEGKHEFDVSSAGISIYPRFEAKFARHATAATEDSERLSFGIETLDNMLFGGLTAASSTVVSGPSGVGKTILGLQFLCEGARHDEQCLYCGFFETPQRLISKAEGVGLALGKHEQRGRVELMWQPPLERSIDAIANSILDKVHERKARRLFIDGIDAFRACSVFPARLTQFFVALSNELRAQGVATLFSEELVLFEPKIEINEIALSAIFENLLLMRYVEMNGELRRVLSILKTRESEYDNSIREFRITARGLEVAPAFETTEAVLSGFAQRTERGSLRKPISRWKRRR